jgi:LmbE family N-acetylglucosaminyl deacetylase
VKNARLLFTIFVFAVISTVALAQVPYGPARPVAAGEILLNLKKLNVVGSVLYVAAHPDDENTLLLAYFAKERLLKTGYLSLTRGDGGQNLIGTEQGEYVGIIRTQELLAARRVDGPDQFFSRAYDFGFSKSTDEAVRTWGRDKVLADVVWRIRQFRPDVVITRFPPDARAGHGHHSASGFLAEEAFKQAGDPTKFPEQLSLVKVWQPKRIMWNVFIPNAFLSTKRPDEPGNLIGIETGLYNPLLGKSYGEIAAESRSQHKSQGFGVPANRNSRVDYLVTKAGDPVTKDPFDGVDLTWKRIPKSAAVQTLVNQTIAEFNPASPAASVPKLIELLKALNQLDANDDYVNRKKLEVGQLLQQCLGLWFETVPTDFAATPNEKLKVTASAVLRADVDALGFSVKLLTVGYPTLGKDSTLNLVLKPNELVQLPTVVQIPANQKISQPYWLEKPIDKGVFQVSEQRLIGLPENQAAVTTSFTFEIGGQKITFSRPFLYKSTDPVDGETYRPFVIQPEVMVNLAEKVYAFPDAPTPNLSANNSAVPQNPFRPVEMVLKAGRANVSGTVRLDVPEGWRIQPDQATFALKTKGEETRVTFAIAPGDKATNGTLRALAITESGTFTEGVRLVEYKHIPTQTSFPTAEAKLLKLDVKVTARNIGYIMGAGDEIPTALRQMGCTVTLLGRAELANDLAGFDAIVVGVRAYNTEDYLKFYQEKLMEYVKNGGTMVVQYATPGGFVNNAGIKVAQIGPYPFTIGRDRVTEEDAKMTFLNPSHPLLNRPNKITDADFDGWIQERGIYFAQDWDRNYEPIFGSHDTNEADKQGSLLYAKYGRGQFMYTGLVFFRELPAGVSGAYRLFANLISAGK